MGKVTGLGGVFFRCENPEQLRGWYRESLGIEAEQYGFSFLWRELDDPERRGYTVWNPFPESTDYFEPSDKQFMINYRVDDLEGLMQKLQAAGVRIAGGVEQYENGKFAWIVDPEGNKVELWEPIEPSEDPYLPATRSD